jgi:hypothetical protein
MVSNSSANSDGNAYDLCSVKTLKICVRVDGFIALKMEVLFLEPINFPILLKLRRTVE